MPVQRFCNVVPGQPRRRLGESDRHAGWTPGADGSTTALETSPDVMETSLMTHEHETVVVESDRGGSGMGAVLGIIAIIVLLAAVWYFALGPGGGSSTTTNNNTTNNNNTVPTVTQPAAPAAS
jgi:hypothetical protein